MIKQLHIVTDLAISSGGLGLAALRYAEAVAQVGDVVNLLVAKPVASPELTPGCDCSRFRILRPPFATSTLRRFFQQYAYIRQLCIQENIQLIHLHGAWLPEFVAAALVARNFKIPYVLSPHGCFEPWALNFKRFKKRFALALYQRRLNDGAAAVFATSDQECKNLRLLGLRNPIAVVPNGVELPSEVRSVTSVKRTKNILFLSRVHPKKGLLNLVDAWAKKRKPGWKITVAGPDEGDHLADVQLRVRQHGLEDDFEFLGIVQGKAKVKCYTNADVFVLPTYSENFGIAVAEALAYGVPAITTTGAPWSELEDYGCGWWVPPTVEGIAEALEKAVHTAPEELVEMGKRGRALVENKYSWPKIGADGLAVYRCQIDKNIAKPSYVCV